MQRDTFSYIILLPENNPSFTVSAQGPPNLTITQLLRANLSRKSPVGFVKNVLAADFDFVLEVFADEEQEEAGWGNNYFSVGVERSVVEVMHYICNGLDCAIPGKLSQLNVLVALGETNILKFPPTKNWRPMVAVGN